MNTEPLIRLHLFFATGNDRALILRQGPSKQFRMILWHRDTDTFEDGQWIKSKVYVELSLFPEGDTWGGGGVFLDNVHYWASGDADIIGRDEGLSRVKLGEPDKGCTTGIRLMTGGRAPLSRAATKRLLADPPPSNTRDLFNRMAVPPGDALDRYDTQGGCLYRRHGMELELIRDFTDMEFQPVRAPYDWRDETDATSWHPLDGHET